MNRICILYNPLAGNKSCKAKAVELLERYPDAAFYDMTKLNSYAQFFEPLDALDTVILCGGDGTLNRFVNDTEGLEIVCKLLYAPMGTGNDFACDLSHAEGDAPISVNAYLKDLPTVTANGKTSRFLNGVGYGIDGYCCDVGDRQKERSEKRVNYTGIAVKGLLFHYLPTNATVTVDGKTHTYKNVWLAPTMNGRFYGGGMMPTPEQNRSCEKKTLSVMVFHGAGKFKTLAVFPSIFSGKHVKHDEMVEILTGHRITVEFDRPTPLQIDGETVLGVTSYTASASLSV